MEHPLARISGGRWWTQCLVRAVAGEYTTDTIFWPSIDSGTLIALNAANANCLWILNLLVSREMETFTARKIITGNMLFYRPRARKKGKLERLPSYFNEPPGILIFFYRENKLFIMSMRKKGGVRMNENLPDSEKWLRLRFLLPTNWFQIFSVENNFFGDAIKDEKLETSLERASPTDLFGIFNVLN